MAPPFIKTSAPISHKYRGTKVTSLKGYGVTRPVGASNRSFTPSIGIPDMTSIDRTNQRIYRSKAALWNSKPKPGSVHLAEDAFDIHAYELEADEPSEYDSDDYRDVTEDEFTFYPEQLTLDLLTTSECENYLYQAIRKHERAYQTMCLHALRWKQLMDDVEANPQIDKAFNDMQLLRKLSGSDFQ